MTFSTTDEKNRVIADVQAGDFAIVDQERVIRDFRSFTRSAYTRMNVAVLVDASGSTSPQFRQELSNVSQLMSESNGVPDDSLSVIAFRNTTAATVCEGNCRTLNAGAQFPAVASGGLTPLYDSIVFAARRLGQRSDPRTRRILILFSDGVDTISLKSFSDALEAAVDSDVAIYCIDVSNSPHSAPGTQVLRSFAASTGGGYFPIEVGTAKVLDAILQDFHASYTVAYKLPSYATGFHMVRILPTHNSGLQFHCRRGYYYPSNPGN